MPLLLLPLNIELGLIKNFVKAKIKVDLSFRFLRYLKQCRVILFPKVIESPSLHIHIFTFRGVVSSEFFLCSQLN